MPGLFQELRDRRSVSGSLLRRAARLDPTETYATALTAFGQPAVRYQARADDLSRRLEPEGNIPDLVLDPLARPLQERLGSDNLACALAAGPWDVMSS